MSPWGSSLRRLRQLRGMKQAHLAQLMCVTQSTVSRWERGELEMSPAQQRDVQRLLEAHPGPAQDAALKRLVQSSTHKVHLICDRTHRLLAVSPSRLAEWRRPLSELLGTSLLVYATPEILQAESTLERRGWYEGMQSSLQITTGTNASLPIRPGMALWERVPLADGSAGRLVTAVA
ncbi:Helix-turn-helix domain-containing protein [Dyella sp. OK004]|uniref:helix-turn-helix domain-containing protein n=1 Tax=Dyella sp. OK004 TaxID=1855292 RepID=UPI0008F0C5E4|nr:helix-turn-helix transcriptional regulator [Dyella sp. OK004]SFR95118.1 Helix-turn-helix domain-containing protein [Dyella sp. OK004]